MSEFTLFGLSVSNLGFAGTLGRIIGFAKGDGHHLVITANPEIMVYAHNHPEYRQILQGASLVVADGIGLVMASYLSSSPLTNGRVVGIDLVKELVKNSGEKGYSVFLVGVDNEILQKATLNLSSSYSKINIVGYKQGPIFAKNAQFPLSDLKNDELLVAINQAKPDILLVGFGHPKQELWLNYYLPQLPVKVGIGVGGSFDYLAGDIKRSPRVLQMIGLEWLWRLFSNPWLRLARIFTAVAVFPILFFVDKLWKKHPNV